MFVFFAILSVLMVQHRYRRWRRTGRRLEGWRLVLMMVALLAMTGAVFAVFSDAPPGVLSALRLVALGAVIGVLVLSLRL